MNETLVYLSPELVPQFKISFNEIFLCEIKLILEDKFSDDNATFKNYEVDFISVSRFLNHFMFETIIIQKFFSRIFNWSRFSTCPKNKKRSMYKKYYGLSGEFSQNFGR